MSRRAHSIAARSRATSRRRAGLMTRLNIHGLGFTLFLALLTALPPLSIDMALPSLALIQADLHAPQTEAAAAIAIFIAGFSSAPIVVGPLADRFGRKAVMGVGPRPVHAQRGGLGARALDPCAARLSPGARGERGGGRHPAAGDHPRPVRGPGGAPPAGRGLARVQRRAADRAGARRGDSVLRLLAPDLCRADRRLRPRHPRRSRPVPGIACAREPPQSEALDDFRRIPAGVDQSGLRGLFAARRTPVRGSLCLRERLAAPVHAGLWRVEDRICGAIRHNRVGRDRRLVDQRLAHQPACQA